MNLRIARIISLILNPLLLIIFVPFFLLYKTTNDLSSALNWTIYTFVFLLGMTVFILYAVRRGIFTDYDVSKREQRPLLFLVAIIMSVIYTVGIIIFQAPVVLYLIVFGTLAGIILASLINTRIKASIHVATVSALIFALAIVYGGYYLLLLILIPVVSYVRVKAKRHTVSETIVGAILGSLLSLMMYFGIKFFIN